MHKKYREKTNRSRQQENKICISMIQFMFKLFAFFTVKINKRDLNLMQGCDINMRLSDGFYSSRATFGHANGALVGNKFGLSTYSLLINLFL